MELHNSSQLINPKCQVIFARALRFEAPNVIQSVLADAQNSTCDLSDLLIGHVAAIAGCDRVLSFDKKACRHPLFRMLKV